MSKIASLLCTLVAVAGCSAGADPIAEDTAATTQHSDTSIPMICSGDSAHFPAAIDSTAWDGKSSLWKGQHGVVVPYYTPTNRNRVQVFGVDLAHSQIVFNVFTDASQVAPNPFPLDDHNPGSDRQQPNCEGPVQIEQGQVKGDNPPEDPPNGAGPWCPDGPCFCTIDRVLVAANRRACPPPPPPPACVPKTCDTSCGNIPDGCGHTLHCEPCDQPCHGRCI